MSSRFRPHPREPAWAAGQGRLAEKVAGRPVTMLNDIPQAPKVLRTGVEPLLRRFPERRVGFAENLRGQGSGLSTHQAEGSPHAPEK